MIFFLFLDDIKIPLIGIREKVTHEVDGLIKISVIFFFFAFKVTNKFFVKRTKFLSYIKKKIWPNFPLLLLLEQWLGPSQLQHDKSTVTRASDFSGKKYLGYPMRHTTEIDNQLKDEEYLE